MREGVKRYLAVVAGVMILAGTLQAKVLSVDLQPAAPGNTYAVNYSGQGAVYDPGNNFWNIAGPSAPAGGGDESGGWVAGPYSKSELKYSDGTPSGMTISWTDGIMTAISDTQGGCQDIASDAKGLMRDYLAIDVSGWSRSLFIEGLTPGQEYHLYLYGSGPWGRNIQFDVRCDKDANMNWGAEQWVGGATTTGGSGAHVLTEGVDYVKFDFTAGAEMDTLWIEYKGVEPDPWAAFNGLQLVAGPETPAPVLTPAPVVTQ